MAAELQEMAEVEVVRNDMANRAARGMDTKTAKDDTQLETHMERIASKTFNHYAKLTETEESSFVFPGETWEDLCEAIKGFQNTDINFESMDNEDNRMVYWMSTFKNMFHAGSLRYFKDQDDEFKVEAQKFSGDGFSLRDNFMTPIAEEVGHPLDEMDTAEPIEDEEDFLDISAPEMRGPLLKSWLFSLTPTSNLNYDQVGLFSTLSLLAHNLTDDTFRTVFLSIPLSELESETVESLLSTVEDDNETAEIRAEAGEVIDQLLCEVVTAKILMMLPNTTDVATVTFALQCLVELSDAGVVKATSNNVSALVACGTKWSDVTDESLKLDPAELQAIQNGNIVRSRMVVENVGTVLVNLDGDLDLADDVKDLARAMLAKIQTVENSPVVDIEEGRFDVDAVAEKLSL